MATVVWSSATGRVRARAGRGPVGRYQDSVAGGDGGGVRVAAGAGAEPAGGRGAGGVGQEVVVGGQGVPAGGGLQLLGRVRGAAGQERDRSVARVVEPV